MPAATQDLASQDQTSQALTNTPQSFGIVARTLHWLTALLILTAIPVGLIANQYPADAAHIGLKALLFSVHKTIGVAAFAIALGRILWALSQPHPAPLHPERRAELRLAALVHWMLYISLLAVPLTGWVHHASIEGFAPILWPLSQNLPLVPESESLAAVASLAHWLFTKLLIAAILLHVAGAIKHHVIDRDATLKRMLRGTIAPENPGRRHGQTGPLLAALAIYAAGAMLAGALLPRSETAPAAVQTAATAAEPGLWAVESGQLGFSVTQMGAAVAGSFGKWQADIQFDETPVAGRNGQVTVTIDLASLTLGSVSDQAKGPEFFDVAQHPTAVFTADLVPAANGYEARGSLRLHGMEKPLTLPFTLTMAGDTAKMTGKLTLDRRDFGIGASYADEATVGFAVGVAIDLTAKRP